MKNFFLALSLMILTVGQLVAGGGPACVIDSSITEPGFYPSGTDLPCIERLVPFDTAVHVLNFDTVNAQDFGVPFPIDVVVNYVRIDSIAGLPAGINYACNPSNCTFQGGERGCINFSGTTTAAVGNYPLTIYATISVDAPAPLGNQTISGTTDDIGYSFILAVIDSGSPCPAPLVEVLNQPLFACPGSSANIDPIIDTGGAVPPFTYAWSPATGLSSTTIRNPVATPTVNTTYTLTVTDDNGYEFTTTVDVELDNTPAPFADFSVVPSGNTVTFTNISSNGTSYSWDFGDGLGSTQASPSHTYASSGTYEVVLIASNNCGSDTSAPQTITITGIRELQVDLGAEVYPNPGSGKFTVKIGGNVAPSMNMFVLNMAGKEVFATQVEPGLNEIDLSAITSGIYFIRIEAEQGVQVIKLAVQ